MLTFLAYHQCVSLVDSSCESPAYLFHLSSSLFHAKSYLALRSLIFGRETWMKQLKDLVS